MPNLDSITFDTSSLRPGRNAPGKRSWISPEGDAIEFHFFDRGPDIPAGLPDMESLRLFYLGLMGNSPDSLDKLTRLTVDGLPALSLIISGPQPQGGTRYMGSIFFPFRDCNYLIKVQCLELHPGTPAAHADTTDEQLEAKYPDHPLVRVRTWLGRIQKSLQIAPDLKASAPFALPAE